MSQEGNTFSPQLPEDSEHSVALYESHPEFRAGLEKIASHIVGGGAPMTFALYGEWGTGKSTALEYLQGLIKNRDGGVTFSWCQAPLWARYQDERSALALQILRGVERGIPLAIAQTLASMLSSELRVSVGQSDGSDYDLTASLGLLNALRSIPDAPPVIEEWIRHYIASQGSIRHVVMLDDLDRCDPEFAAKLLRATNHWTTELGHVDAAGERRKASIYFILACQEDFLVKSQAQGEVRDPRQSLEKYVHVTVSIPRLLSRPADAAGYLMMLVSQLQGLPSTARDRLAAMIDQSARTYPEGLLSPLLRVADHSSTPRAVKTRLNLVLTELDYEQLEDETLLKEWIIKAFWPDFWANQYRPFVMQSQSSFSASQRYQDPSAISGYSGNKIQPSTLLSDRFQPIRAVGARIKGLLDMSDEALIEALNHIGAEVRADLSDVRPQLAIYLASDPPWPAEPTAGGSVVFAGDGRSRASRSEAEKIEDQDTPSQRLASDLLPYGMTSGDASQTTQLVAPPSGPELPSDPDDQIFIFYMAADSAEDDGDRQAVEYNLGRLLEVARRVGASTTHGTEIGNAALIADRQDIPELAYELHQLARAALPNHYNIMQNYINFILDKEIAAEYPEARRLYQILTTTGRDHRPLRTLTIGIRLDVATSGTIPNSEMRAQKLLSLLADEPTASRLYEIIRIPPSLLGYDTLRSACKIVVLRSDNKAACSACLHLLTSALGRSSNPVHEREVTDMIRWMISCGVACVAGVQAYANTLYNLAAQLGSLGYQRAATLIYSESYLMVNTDADFRRSLASSLERMDRKEDATAVLLGRPPHISDIEAEHLPTYLSAGDETERWWESLSMAGDEPCPTNLPWLIPPAEAGQGEHA